MNEKIKALLEQAKTQVEHGEGCYPATTVRYDALEKFAELIIKECQFRVEQYINDCGEIGSLPDSVIMKHFGIEE